ncbi:hypothetical protein B5F79_05785 [Olsenella sp. An285]|uniref:hypothetical protein n=1 Tax=Olsenella sp. An285 TaxID=1965621 RepID=UPI000B3A3128|nr:hypothetical protein [Olsenella sp. An285]OUO47040.1 hypothetical protein B5F79_05785 [Olsenella sp. An285]
MKSFVIGHECSRRTVALVTAVSALAAAAAAWGGTGFQSRPPFDALPLDPWMRGIAGALVCLALGALALQQVVLGSERWELTKKSLRYRSVTQRAGFLRYAGSLLAGREPEPDVLLAIAAIRRVELRWRRQVVSFAAAGGLPSLSYPVTVRMTLDDGTTVEFSGLERDPATLGAALAWLKGLSNVVLVDPDRLLDEMLDPSQSLYDHLARLDATRDER